MFRGWKYKNDQFYLINRVKKILIHYKQFSFSSLRDYTQKS